MKNYKKQVYTVQGTAKRRPTYKSTHAVYPQTNRSRQSPVEGGGHSSSRLPSVPHQISRTCNPITRTNADQPRDPPQPTRQDRAEVNPPTRLLQPIKHPPRQRLLRLSIRIIYFKRRADVRDGFCDRPKAGCEAVFVEAVA